MVIKLSIIITYYKTYDLTVKLLNGLRPQKNNEIEIILVDDGCHEERLDKFKDIANIIHLEENKGFAHALNIGTSRAKGEYIGFIDSDDLVVNDYIETLLDTLKERNEEIIFFDWQDMNNGTIVHHPSNYAIWKAIYKKEIIPPFNERWKYSADVPFQRDLNQVEHTKYYIDKVLYLYNSNREGSLTVEKEKIRRNNMIRCEVIKEFDLKDFDKLEDIQRKSIDTKGKLYVGDTFRCDKEMAEYLMGNNPLNIAVVKIIEVIPKKEEDIDDFKEEPKEPVVEHIENIEETKTSSKKSKKRKGK